MKWKKNGLVLLATALLALAYQAQATMMLKMDLNDLTDRAATIFRGTVLSVEQSAIEAGGGQIPAITYRFKVDELYKGEATIVKGDDAIIQVRMLGSVKPAKADENGRIKLSAWNEVPKFNEGGDYLVFASQASAIGLSAPIGLGQGAFKVYAADGTDMAVNEFNNAGLGLNGDGPVEYTVIDAKIRSLLGQ